MSAKTEICEDASNDKIRQKVDIVAIQSGNLAIWQSGNLTIWQSGNLAILQSRNLVIWQSLENPPLQMYERFDTTAWRVRTAGRPRVHEFMKERPQAASGGL